MGTGRVVFGTVRRVWGVLLLVVGCAQGGTLYVSPSGTDLAPYTNWLTAATTIQDAIDAASSGDTVLVTNGTFITGEFLDDEDVLNRVVIPSGIVVRSVNGPLVATIEGQAFQGSRAVRCAYVGDGARLEGFTLMDGEARFTVGGQGPAPGGGAYCESSGLVSNCHVSGNLASHGGGTAGGVIQDCVLSSNTAVYGGGAFESTVQDCTVRGNVATLSGAGTYRCTVQHSIVCENVANHTGGGTFQGEVDHCTVYGNSAVDYGGGTYGGIVQHSLIFSNVANSGGGSFQGTIENSASYLNGASFGGGADRSTVRGCTIFSNDAYYGGGVNHGTVENCLLYGNFATNAGGGTYGCTVENSDLNRNRAELYGGGTYRGTVLNCYITYNHSDAYGGGTYLGVVQNCSITKNTARLRGAGSFYSTNTNCIIYYNTAPQNPNYDLGSRTYTCTTPLSGGEGNISGTPYFRDPRGGPPYQLRSYSPCINAGKNLSWMVGAVDFEGNPRIQGGVADMGCFEFAANSPDIDGDGVDDDWEMLYFLSLTNFSYNSDWDGDGFRDGSEFHAGTSPTAAGSYLGIKSVTINPLANEVVIRWSSVSNKTYSLFGSSSPTNGWFELLDLNIPADPPENVYTAVLQSVSGWMYNVGVVAGE